MGTQAFVLLQLKTIMSIVREDKTREGNERPHSTQCMCPLAPGMVPQRDCMHQIAPVTSMGLCHFGTHAHHVSSFQYKFKGMPHVVALGP